MVAVPKPRAPIAPAAPAAAPAPPAPARRRPIPAPVAIEQDEAPAAPAARPTTASAMREVDLPMEMPAPVPAPAPAPVAPPAPAPQAPVAPPPPTTPPAEVAETPAEEAVAEAVEEVAAPQPEAPEAKADETSETNEAPDDSGRTRRRRTEEELCHEVYPQVMAKYGYLCIRLAGPAPVQKPVDEQTLAELETTLKASSAVCSRLAGELVAHGAAVARLASLASQPREMSQEELLEALKARLK